MKLVKHLISEIPNSKIVSSYNIASDSFDIVFAVIWMDTSNRINSQIISNLIPQLEYTDLYKN